MILVSLVIVYHAGLFMIIASWNVNFKLQDVSAPEGITYVIALQVGRWQSKATTSSSCTLGT